MSLSKELEVVIINIGYSFSPVLEKTGLKVYNIVHNKCSITSIYKKFKVIAERESPDVLHSFDIISNLFVRLYSLSNNIKSVITKCGGSNPKYFYPYAKNLILFSNENKNFFKNKRKYYKTKIDLIPNRVMSVRPDRERLDNLKKKISE